MIAIDERKRRPRLVGWRVYATALAIVLVGLFVVASVMARVDDGAVASPEADDCVQRVRDWSPSRQAHIMRVQSFCG